MSEMPNLQQRVLDASVRAHLEAVHTAGVCVEFDKISERTRRLVANQLRGTVDAVIAAFSIEAELLAAEWDKEADALEPHQGDRFTTREILALRRCASSLRALVEPTKEGRSE